jgi:hypothetical protein
LPGGRSRIPVFVKSPEALPKDGHYRYSHDVKELRDALAAILGKDADRAALPKNMVIPVRLIYPVGEKAEEIMLRAQDSER